MSQTNRDQDASALAARLLDVLAARGWRLATAESCTGGRIAALVTSRPGSSAVFVGGVVTYANEAKTALLGVPAAMLAAEGAVSEAVARAMAEGARTRLGAEIAVSATGVAGPGGGSAEKPVGNVWIGLADAAGSRARLHRFPGDREQVQERAAEAAIAAVVARAERDAPDAAPPTRR